MAPHSSTLAWKIPWTEEPGRLQSTGVQRVGHDWMTSFTFHFPALEKELATHSSVLAWRIPGMAEPGVLSSLGSHRVGHDWSDLAAAAATVVCICSNVSWIERRPNQSISKENQSLIFMKRTDAEAPILWPPDVKSWLIGKDPDAGKDWRSEEKGITEDEMVGWHHWLNRHEFEQSPGDGKGQGNLEGMLQSKGSQRVGHDEEIEQ